MRTSHAATALAGFTAGLTAAAALRRLTGQRVNETMTAATDLSAIGRVPDHDAAALPFAHPVEAGTVPKQLKSPARCGESGGRTKTGASCGARTVTGGRCHNHPMAA